MTGSENRFRRLPPRKRENGDLFEHYGVPVEAPVPGSIEQLPVRDARACPSCGWYGDPKDTCDNCGDGGEPR